MTTCLCAADPKWVVYDSAQGPGRGKQIVLISGDEEYRSEEALPQLGKILAERHGFRCTVLFAIDPATGDINPNHRSNIPGLEALDSADMMVIFTRFRDLPDDQMRHIDGFLRDGKPVIGMRTATHAFNLEDGRPWSHYANAYAGDRTGWEDGFGRLVLGEKWISHHGQHKHESTRGVFAPDAAGHPILRGIADGDIWGPTDVYGVRLPLPGDAQPLVLGQVVARDGEFNQNDPFYGMRPSDHRPVDGEKNDPMMPIAWTKSYQVPGGKPGRSFTTTMGASTDLANEGVRRLLVNAAYWLTGLVEEIPADGTNVDVVGEFVPTAYEFRPNDFWSQRKMQVAEHEL
ncbi:MAG: ThuA domain-containing protein [Planctomycetaceae bacterium]